ncbi:P-aminobenzoate N-oxygenase AurF [Mycobacteroides abscessus subsp. massiliense]|uniref:AurF N-oxygenase family protein n=1 Tax=Mycobacteroides abscessus TaxID=36809 RepID=UPI0009A74314|nr:diiron oxygenase [Mycobacteroides abscessus]SKH50457.1 P-aminobenzoate N-oxygenase AurF [Mycobacteroides abscessus subsp. massiliense]SKH82521.1 P-aminobenzoate N-oxygenase AurF [Mycobacteroides abscessus subsp. massiliense]SKK35941.1 P-aminobenzoate N-oxygenase AurF [Mycobacteroides abscessus subsp. massiliense]SKK43726.1 P-aminobenzoate N-oxygenase AurF [Mycobacteroides abscessus subsp. massiliense]SKL85611.1 P-aminobenzoate N-oxygenase AurF [Mycobacteroides abscessus subsp. massiliense]
MSKRRAMKEVRGDAKYVQVLETLSHGSTNRNFDPFIDIDWDSPEYAVIPNDSRWVLPRRTDPLGRHPWYQSQPLEKQIEIGMWRQANVARVGLQFESLLIRGLIQFAFSVPNGSPEFRYLNHESIEECNHTLMFQEMVNRLGVDVPGMPRLIRWLSPFIPLTSTPLPVLFFILVLGGEEPIDHSQKNVLREGDNLHPIMKRVMEIHVAEEARHISFAHEYLRKRVPQMNWLSRLTLSVATPIIMRIMLDLIMTPPRSFFHQFGMPKNLRKELFWKSPASRQTMSEVFSDVRMLCREVGMMNPIAKITWRLMRIDGRAARYRSEPQRGPLVNYPQAALEETVPA